jgi:D-galactarolactone cycloisomerase
MRLVSARTYDMRYPVQRPFANSCGWNRWRRCGLVELRTDDGRIGWGEGSAVASPGVLAEHVVGCDPFDVAVLGRAAVAAGCSPAAWSGVDIALWDLMGQAVERPVHQLLGGAARRSIPVYASGLFLYDAEHATEGLEAEAAAYAQARFSAVKMKIGFGPRVDERRVAVVRHAIGPDVLLAVDANCAYDAATAIASARAVAAHDIYWYEEPVAPTEVEAYLQVKAAAPMQLAGGESLEGLGGFRDLVSKRALDIVQPDISIAGGFTACRRIDALAEAHGVRVLPHMWGSSIRLAATLHWQAVLPEGPGLLAEPSLFEYDMTENGLRTELSRQRFEPHDGMLEVPQGPGLGVDVDRPALERWCVATQSVEA